MNDPPPPESYNITEADVAEAIPRLERWSLAERFGWSLEYVDSLSVQDIQELVAIDEGREKYRKSSK